MEKKRTTRVVAVPLSAPFGFLGPRLYQMTNFTKEEREREREGREKRRENDAHRHIVTSLTQSKWCNHAQAAHKVQLKSESHPVLELRTRAFRPRDFGTLVGSSHERV